MTESVPIKLADRRTIGARNCPPLRSIRKLGIDDIVEVMVCGRVVRERVDVMIDGMAGAHFRGSIIKPTRYSDDHGAGLGTRVNFSEANVTKIWAAAFEEKS